jgi:hypothetical protein
VFPSVLQCPFLPKKVAIILQNDLFCLSITFKLMACRSSEIVISECHCKRGTMGSTSVESALADRYDVFPLKFQRTFCAR